MSLLERSRRRAPAPLICINCGGELWEPTNADEPYPSHVCTPRHGPKLVELVQLTLPMDDRD